MKRSFGLRARFALAFGMPLALLVIVAVAGVLQVRSVAEASTRHSELAQLQQAATQWSGLTALNVARAVTLARAGSPPALRGWIEGEMKETSARIGRLQQQLDAGLAAGAGQGLMADVARHRRGYLELRGALLGRLAVPAQAAAARGEVESRLQPAATAYLASLDAVQAHVTALSREQDARRQALLRQAGLLLPAIAALALLVGSVLAWRIAGGLVRVVRELRGSAARIAEGDLTQPVAVDRDDELGELQQALARMQTGLAEMVGGIRGGTDSVGTAATQIASGNDDLSARTERAAGSLQQTAATMAQLGDAMHRSTGSAGEAQQLARTAVAVARRGGEVVSEVARTMAEINEDSGRISDITGVIDAIAFQTNILAINAAVEAARAGEGGRGFAVVATEVRNLAQRCAEAAGEIRELIEGNVRKVEAGARLVRGAGDTMQQIESGVHEVTEAIAGITAAATAQAGGFGEVNHAVAQLDQITQQNAALVQESAAAAQSLRDQALALVRMVASFRIAGHAA